MTGIMIDDKLFFVVKTNARWDGWIELLVRPETEPRPDCIHAAHGVPASWWNDGNPTLSVKTGGHTFKPYHLRHKAE